jgi:hypothetical protein
MQLNMYVTDLPHSPYMLENRKLTVFGRSHGIFQDITPLSIWRNGGKPYENLRKTGSSVKI